MNGMSGLAIRRLGYFLVLFLGLSLGGCGGDGGDPTGPLDPPPRVPCLTASPQCWEQVPVGNASRLPVFRTHPIQIGDSTVVRAVIVVHGANRNPDYYFETMVDAVELAGLTDKTLVIAPHFQTAGDGPAMNEPAWTDSGWKRGDLSKPRAGAVETISSYEAVDDVLRYLGDTLKYPKLGTVLVTGHSAGGQYAHRFAATSLAEDELTHLRFRYVVANPSTYLYLGPERDLPGGEFDLPNREDCTGYNKWHYGLENRNTYALRFTEDGIRVRLVTRDVVYMVGMEDTGESLLDMSCGAMLQGIHRYARGLTLFDYMNAFYPQNEHQLSQIAGVGHSSKGVYQSILGRRVLFEW